MEQKRTKFETGLVEQGINGSYIVETAEQKIFKSDEYNYTIDKRTGYFQRWGATQEQNPFKSFFGPEIADIEITTICNGPGGKLCPFCYKGNTNDGHNMTFEEFKKIFHKIPRTLTQIAFGGDAGGITNPDLFKMMEYCRYNDYNQVVPNITVADISDEVADRLAILAGAVSVSFYKHAGKEYCYDSIKKLTDRGMKQVNMHWVISKESITQIDELIEDIKHDPRLSKLNAIVILSLKTKGRGEKFGPTTQEEYSEVIKKLFDNNIPLGSDSCGAMKFLKAIEDRPDFDKIKGFIEPCESGKFSLYLDSYGKVYPCSFMEKVYWNSLDNYNGIQEFDLLSEDIKDSNDFLNKVWNSKEFENFAMGTECANCTGEGCQYYVI